MEFTVVIPLYNKERHISRAIASVLNQTHRDLELIVVDDGSTDRGVSKVKMIKDPRIRIIKQENSGVSAARNRGITEASSEFIAFLDADDAWKPNFLEVIQSLIEDYPEAGAYGTGYEFSYQSSKRVLPNSILSFEKDWHGLVDDYFRAAMSSPLLSASSVVIPKKVFNNIGLFTVGVKRGEDLEMWCRIALNYKIAFSSKICATYFQDTDNRSGDINSSLEDSFSAYSEEFLNDGRKMKNHSTFFDEYMIKLIIRKARYYVEDGRKREAREVLLRYKNTKYHKKLLVLIYIFSFLPKSSLSMVSHIRNLIKNSL